VVVPAHPAPHLVLTQPDFPLRRAELHRARISENAAIFDFTLTDAEMKQVDALDQDKRVGPDPLHVSF
jgi:diketogulonate reductase-like aldo/keto reductase